MVENRSFFDNVGENEKAARRQLASTCRYLGRMAVTSDPIFASHCEAMVEEIGEGRTGQILYEGLVDRKEYGNHPVSAKAAIELHFRKLQQCLLAGAQTEPEDIWGKTYPKYPDVAYTDTSLWVPVSRHIFFNGQAADNNREAYVHTLSVDVVQSNVEGRYVSHAMLMSAFRGMLGENPTVFDGGTSALMGPIKLLSPDSPFARLRVKGDFGIGKKSAISRKLNRFKHTYPVPELVVGADMMPLDEVARGWIETCSVRGMEWLNKEILEQRKQLRNCEQDLMDSGKLKFVKADISAKYDKEAIRSITPEGGFDVTTATTTMYLMLPEERDRVRQLYREITSKNGIIIYQDFCNYDPEDRTKLIFHEEKWPEYSYRTLIEFPGDGDGKLYEVFQFRTGRCKEMRPGADYEEVMRRASNAA
jgi:hypothetical protein